MTYRVVIGVAVTVMLAAFMVTSMAIIMTDSALAQGLPRIVINLTGSQEVPPVLTGSNRRS